MKFKSLMMAALGAAFFMFAFIPAASAEEGTGYRAVPYVGLTIGYGTEVFRADDTLDLSDQSFSGGAFAGFGTFVDGVYLGIEIDGILRNVNAKVGDGALTVQAEQDYVFTGRVRVGLPVGPALIYGTAGVAAAKSSIGIIGMGDDSQTVFGLAAGGGVELQITRTMMVRIEGMHLKFEEENFTVNGLTASVDQSETVVRGGLAFALN